jgi:N-acetylglucosamine-6-phosphate deacetylase
MITKDVELAGLWVERGRAERLSVHEGRLVARGPASAEANELWILPGLCDLHVHGGAGCDFSDGTHQSAETICRLHAAHGTTSLCATVLAEAPDRTLRAVSSLASMVGKPTGGARIRGINLEGPFLNPRFAGAQAREHLRVPDRGLIKELLAAGDGHVRIVTLAPELPGALEMVEFLAGEGVAVSLGHSAASYAQVLAAVAGGARLVTHLYNAMSGLHHREPGLAGAALDCDRLTTELIADGHHVSDPAMRLAWRCKGPRKLALVTDCTAALATPKGRAPRLGRREVLVENGAVRLADGTLAGSCLTMSAGLFRFGRAIGDDQVLDVLRATLPVASRSPFAVLQGATAPRKAGPLDDAHDDFVVIDATSRRVVATIVDGLLEYEAETR